MKILLVILLLASAQVASALKVPKSVHRAKDIETARIEAATQEKPICFLYTNSKLLPS